MKEEFVIQNNVLLKYIGASDQVIVPKGVKAIAGSAFAGHLGVSGITLPDSLVEIRPNAFDGCGDLTSIVLPERVAVIQSGAFRHCKKLVEITLPSGLTEIEESAFAGCYSLKSIVLPDSVRRVGRNAFAECLDLQSVVLPADLEEIKDGTFEHCGSLSSVRFPRGLTRIGASAFEGCGFTSLVLPDTISQFGIRCFAYCNRLCSVVLPKGADNVANMMFLECRRLASVVLPEGVATIQGNAFRYCDALKSVYLPDSLRRIEDAAFYGCSNLTEVRFPEGLAAIGEKAFYACINLHKFRLPREIEVGRGAFDMCYAALAAFRYFERSQDRVSACMAYLNGEADEYADQERIVAYARRTRGSLLKMIVSEHNVKAFAKLCEVLATKLPLEDLDAALNEAGEDVELKNVILDYKAKAYSIETQNKLEDIQTEKALGVRRLTVADYKKMFTLREVDEGYCVAEYKGSDSHVAIPATIGSKTVINVDGMFSPAIRSLYLPATVTTVRIGCPNAAELQVDPANPAYCAQDGMLLDKAKTTLLWVCPAVMGRLEIPEGVETIAPKAMALCNSIATIYIPASLRSCKSLPRSGLSAFEVSPASKRLSACNGLLLSKDGTMLSCVPTGISGRVVVPEGVKVIPKQCFAKHHDITSVDLPESVHVIQEWAFSDCHSLNMVIIRSSEVRFGHLPFARSSLVIRGIPHSSVAYFAKEAGIPFEPLD